MSSGFGVAISIDAPVEPRTSQFTRIAFAVELAEPFEETVWMTVPLFGYLPVECICIPIVEDMWVNVQGDSNYWPVTNKIVDNTGTGGKCSFDWLSLFIDVLMTVLPGILFELHESPPEREWESDAHWLKAIVREKALNDPPLQTAGANFYSYFDKKGYNTLDITAGGSISLRCFGFYQGFPVSTILSIGEYSSDFQVSVPVTSAPNMPSTPSGPTSGYTLTTYSYSTSTTDPNGDSVRYEFDWGDGSNTTTGWYASGFTATASHSWSSPRTYQVKVRAQDSYYEYSDWSPYLTVNIEWNPSTPVGGIMTPTRIQLLFPKIVMATLATISAAVVMVVIKRRKKKAA